MTGAVPHITVIILTCNRLAWLERLLDALETQKTDGKFTCSVRVVDNDPAQSARAFLHRRAAKSRIQADCDCEPEKNLGKLRNLGALNSRGEYVAYMDDDEFPVHDWLWHLMRIREQFQADGVLGPVRPHFETPPPKWIVRSGVCDRPVLPTGLVLTFDQTRTGNVLLKRSLFDAPENLFSSAFALHGEDRDFFRRLILKGHKFVWCEEAAAYETQPLRRCQRAYHLRRALLRGSISWRHAPRKAPVLLKTLAAFCLYTLGLPFLLLGGQGLFMKYLVKDCDHAGRLLAACGISCRAVHSNPLQMQNHQNWIIDPTDPVLVTGANGFIGARVAATLLQRGFQKVRCLVRSVNDAHRPPHRHGRRPRPARTAGGQFVVARLLRHRRQRCQVDYSSGRRRGQIFLRLLSQEPYKQPFPIFLFTRVRSLK